MILNDDHQEIVIFSEKEMGSDFKINSLNTHQIKRVGHCL